MVAKRSFFESLLKKMRELRDRWSDPREEEKRLTILIVHEGPIAVARCLEHDIVAQGDSIDEALGAWRDVFIAQALLDLKAGREPLADIGPAPRRFHELYKTRARRLADGVEIPKSDIPDPWMIAAMRSEVRAL